MKRVVALVPTHNRLSVLDTIETLISQTHPVDIVVIADNCTQEVLSTLKSVCANVGAVLHPTVGNKARKAGALNQGLHSIRQSGYDYVLCMDDDTRLALDCVEQGVKSLSVPAAGAVCSRAGVLPHDKDTAWLGRVIHRYQKVEYGSFDAVRVGTPGRIQVVSGMCALYRTDALSTLLLRDGYFFDERSIVEDHDLTIRLRRCGYKTDLSLDMYAWTEVPTTVPALWNQRARWYRGAIRELVTVHGLSRVTLPEYGNHALFIALSLIEFLICLTIIQAGSFTVTVFSLAVWFSFYGLALYRLSYVQDLEWKDVALRLPPLDLPYRLFLAAALLNGYARAFSAKKGW